MILTWALGILFATSLGLFLWQVAAGLAFPLRRKHPVAAGCSLSAVTILKPLKGRDPETRKCLESWFIQDYPQAVQLLFGVDSENDPVCHLVQELMGAYPNVSAQLIVCRSVCEYPNGKVGKLIELSRHADHDIWVICDADVSAPVDFLRQTVGLLEAKSVGLIHSLYRLHCPNTAAMQWEAIGVNVDFWCQVLQARQLGPLDFALGAAMVTTRKHVAIMGGFEALGNHLADDYHLGNLLAQRGYELILSHAVVECNEPLTSWRNVWKHQLRWARTIRCCKPVPYFFSILNNVTLWSCLLWLFARVGADSNVESLFFSTRVFGWGLELHWASWLLIAGLGIRVSLGVVLHRRFTGRTLHPRWWGIIMVKDVFQVVLWGFAFTGNRVDWRGEIFRLGDDGRIIIPPDHSQSEKAEIKVELPSCLDDPVPPVKRP